MRKRFHPVDVTGDLKKAFLQVRIKEEDRDSHRFHWQPTEARELQTLRFTRALFGLTCSPFLLGDVIEHHLSTWEDRMPEEVNELRKSIYVDDLVSGGKTVEEAKKLKTNATGTFNDATITRHKWHSNKPELEYPSTNLAAEVTYAKKTGTTRGEESSLPGLSWDKSSNTISIVTPSESETPTKRGTLQKTCKHLRPFELNITSNTSREACLPRSMQEQNRMGRRDQRRSKEKARTLGTRSAKENHGKEIPGEVPREHRTHRTARTR